MPPHAYRAHTMPMAATQQSYTAIIFTRLQEDLIKSREAALEAEPAHVFDLDEPQASAWARTHPCAAALACLCLHGAMLASRARV